MASQLRREAGYHAGCAVTCFALAILGFFTFSPMFVPFIFTDRPHAAPGTVLAIARSGMKNVWRVDGQLSDGSRFATFCPRSPSRLLKSDAIVVTFNAERTSFGVQACDEEFAVQGKRASTVVVLLVAFILAMAGGWQAWAAMRLSWRVRMHD
ncbi:MAG: hypothetical protein ACKVP7_20290 [Hyphomicrobiaceae bacterium]